MPFYDYRCTNTDCRKLVEFHDTATNIQEDHNCPDCGSKMKMKIPNVNFKIAAPKPKDIKHSERRKRWNSKDPKEVMSLTN